MWVVVPAAGRGERFSTDIPKQYADLGGDTVLMRALRQLALSPHVNGLCVALATGDAHWPAVSEVEGKPVITVEGGVERSDSVLAGLFALPDEVGLDDFVLVHDAARPCVTVRDVDALIGAGKEHPVGALLAVPVVDTVKYSGDGARSHATLDRTSLWRALTPQMFRRGVLQEVLAEAIAEKRPITDEASAMEYVGRRPLLVTGSAGNIKITTPDDLTLARALLRG